MPSKPTPRAARFAFVLLPLALLPLLAGCGSKVADALKVQETLAECLRHAQVDPDDKQARQWADRAIAIAPNDPAAYLGDPSANAAVPQLSLNLIFGEIVGEAGVGDYPALADYMAQAVAKFPNDERGYQSLIDADDHLGRDADKKATAAKLVALLTQKIRTPGATDLQTLTLAQAQAYWDSGDAVNGALAYQNAIKAYPAQPDPLNGLAYDYAVSNTRLPEALALVQQALALARKQSLSDEQIALYQDTLGWVQYRQGDYAAAEDNLQQAANVLPRLPDTRYHLGMVYAAQGKTDAARAELGHAVLLAQGYAAAQAALDALPKSTAS